MSTFHLKPGSTDLTDTGSYEEAAVPSHATNDEIVVRAGKWDIPGVNIASALSITSLANLFFEDGFLGTWGAGSAMLCPIGTAINWDAMGGICRHSANAGAVPLLQINGSGQFFAEGGTWTTVRNSGSGQLYLGATTTLVTVESNAPGAYTFVYAPSGSDRVAALNVHAGIVVCERNVDLGNIGASLQAGQGVLTMQNDAIFTDGSSGGSFNLHGGRLNMKSAGTVAVTGNFYAGDYSMAGAKGNQTITNGFVTGLARAKRSSGAYTLTITNETVSGQKDSLGLPPTV